MQTNRSSLKCMLPREQSRYLTAEEERKLYLRIRKGCNDARNKLVERNMHLAMRVASQYRGRGVDLEDLIQQANLGLIKAAEKFDPDKGRFTTYAVWWINQQIKRKLDSYREIRLPTQINDAVTKYNHTYTEVNDENIDEFLATRKIRKKSFISALRSITRSSDCIDEVCYHKEEFNVDKFETLFDDYSKDLEQKKKDILRRRLFFSETFNQIGRDMEIGHETVRLIFNEQLHMFYMYLRKKGYF